MNWRAGCRFAVSALMASMCSGIAGTALAIDIYKWVDEDGVTHYSDEQPSGTTSQLIPEATLSVIPGDWIEREAASARAAERDQAPNQNPIMVIGVPEVDQRALAERRALMLQDCHVNNGIDCEREVDTELRAERLPVRFNVIIVSSSSPLYLTYWMTVPILWPSYALPASWMDQPYLR